MPGKPKNKSKPAENNKNKFFCYALEMDQRTALWLREVIPGLSYHAGYIRYGIPILQALEHLPQPPSPVRYPRAKRSHS